LRTAGCYLAFFLAAFLRIRPREKVRTDTVMKLAPFSSTIVIAATLLTGCTGGKQTSNGTVSACGSSCSTASSGSIFILNASTVVNSGTEYSTTTPSEIVGESIVSGKLTPTPGSPWILQSEPLAACASPSGNLLFVSTVTDVLAYPISNGKLGAATQVSSDPNVQALAIDATGSWLIEAVPSTQGVLMKAMPVDPTTGASTNGTNAPSYMQYQVTNGNLQQGKIAISPDDRNIFAALGAGGTIVVPFNSGVGSSGNPLGATPLIVSPVNAEQGAALAVAVDPQGRQFYIGEAFGDVMTNWGALRVFAYSPLASSTLTEVKGSPFALGVVAPNFVLPVASGNQVYVASGNGNTLEGAINGFTISANGGTYTIASASSVVAGIQPSGLAADSTGNYLLAINALGDSNSLSPLDDAFFVAYTFDAKVPAQLDEQFSSNTGAVPVAIVAAP
jgi:hypothetical protein